MESFRVKAAFLGGVAAAAGKFAPAAASAARKFVPQAASMVTRGLGGELKKQVGVGAAAGGLLTGGLEALGAEEGQRGAAFRRGALQGATTGALMGAATAPISSAGRNLRAAGLGRMGGTPEAAKATMDRSLHGGVKDLFTGRGPMGRRGAAFETIAAPLQFGAEMALPAAAMGAVQSRFSPDAPQLPQQQQAPKYAASSTQPPMVAPKTQSQEEGFKFEPVYVAPFTSTAGAGMVDAALEHFQPQAPGVNPSFLRKRALPALGAAALTIPTVKAIRAMYPEPEPLADIDVDALKMYFGKTPQTPG